MRIDGRVVNIGDISDLDHKTLLNLAERVSQEVKRRIGRCDLCGRHHNSFQLCSAEPPIKIDQDNDFEARFRQRLGNQV